MRLLVLIAALLLPTFLVMCTSRTVPGTRFDDSAVLAAPALTSVAANPDQFSFAFFGDSHVGGDSARLERILTAVRADGDDFVILLGDITDDGNRDAITLVKTKLNDFGFGTNYLPVIGNHDVFKDGWENYKELLGPSHYVTDYGNSRFIVLDTADATVDRTQYEWLRGELNKPKPKNTFFLSHYLPVIPGQRTYLKIANEEESLRLMKLAQNHNVKAWLGAHYHSFISETLEGVQYVVAGGAGGRRMEPVSDYFYVRAVVSGENIEYTMKVVE